MSLGNDAQWYLAALANNNGNSAAAWKKYAHQLEWQVKKLQGDVVEWQASAVANAASVLTYKEILKRTTGKESAADVLGGQEPVEEMIEKYRPIAKERLGAEYS